MVEELDAKVEEYITIMDHFDSNLDLPQQERRPPIYNAEDYVLGLKKFCKLTGKHMY